MAEMEVPDEYNQRWAMLENQARRRLTDARRQKAPFEYDMREGYVFTAPHRAMSVGRGQFEDLPRIQDK
jgi:hypothetical protein